MRFFAVVPAPGELVLSRDSGGGLRHFLDGRAVETGTALRLVGTVPDDGSTFFSRARAQLVRYESRLDGQECDVVLVFENGDERFATPADRFEWVQSKGGGR